MLNPCCCSATEACTDSGGDLKLVCDWDRPAASLQACSPGDGQPSYARIRMHAAARMRYHMCTHTLSHVTDALVQGVLFLVQQSAQRACDMRLHTHACATAYVLIRFLTLAQGSSSGPTKCTEGLRHHSARSAWFSSCHGALGWTEKKRKKESLRHHPEGVLYSRYAL